MQKETECQIAMHCMLFSRRSLVVVDAVASFVLT